MPSHSHPHPHLRHRKQDRPHRTKSLPGGFFRTLRSRTSGHPELRLAAAVLEDAVHSFQLNRGAGEYHRRHLYWEVEQWFASRSPAPVFSFENVCSILGLEADEIRRHLQRWAERRLDGPVPRLLEWTQPRPRRTPLRLVTPA